MSSHNDFYKEAGVDIEVGNQFVRKIKDSVKSTYRPEVLGDLGGFGGLFQLNLSRFKQPVLVSGTDGVGTKLRVAQLAGKHDTVGIDLVAMCVNDIIVQGAEPLFFLDYIGVGKLNSEAMVEVVAGIAEGCRQAGCALIGGETAEMPGMYHGEDYDLAGFSVGMVDKDQMITGETIVSGDVLLGMPSSGIHSNGYSLVRKIIFEQEGLSCEDILYDEVTVGDALLTPTRIYVKTLLALMQKVTLKGLVHVTGGGFTENIPRVLPENSSFEIREGSWPELPIFSYLQEKGGLSPDEMRRTFNCGIGMVIVVSAENVSNVKTLLKGLGEEVFEIGCIVSCSGMTR
jgi:phosphoribosylformylglycinamidine cyclo-ligase